MSSTSVINDNDSSLRRLSGALNLSNVQEPNGAVQLNGPIQLSWASVGLWIHPPKPKFFKRLLNPNLLKKWKEDAGYHVISGVPGQIEPGEFVGILGESGAGKTLLLRVLAGKTVEGQPEGVVLVNGKHRSAKDWNRHVSYIEAHDIYDPLLTVREVLRFAVSIKLSAKKHTREEKEQMSERLIAAVELTHCADTRCKHLSTGERRRLSIAEELAAQRYLVCLDEPTSGLDTSTALEITQMLRELARKYRLSIICVVHQPRAEILELFDRLLLLSRGRCMFYGSLDEAIEHFQSVSGEIMPARENPANYLMDMVSMNRLNSETKARSDYHFREFRKAWLTLETNQLNPMRSRRARRRENRQTLLFRAPPVLENVERAVDNEKWPVSNWAELTLLLQRYWRGEYRDVRGCLVFFVLLTILALFHGFSYFQLTLDNFGGFQSRIGVCVATIAVPITILSGHLGGVFAESFQVFRKETSSHSYRVYNGYNARLLSVLPLYSLSMTVFSTILYYLSGLRTDSFTHFLVFIAFTWLALLSMMLLGVIMVLFDIPLLGVYFGMGFFAVCGILVRIPDMSPILSWLRFLSPVYYVVQGLIQNETAGLVFNDGTTGDQYLAEFAFNEISVMWCAGALMITIVGYYIISLAGLHYKTRAKFIVL